MKLEDKIKCIAFHSMNFVVCRLMEECFFLAFEKELSDLKGLVKANSYCEADETITVLDVELSLLDVLDDPVIKVLMGSVHRVLECSRTFRMINGLESFDLIGDDKCYDFAAGLYYSYDTDEADEEKGYGDRLYALYSHYMIFQMVLSHCACLFMFKKLEAYKEADAIYFDRTDDLFEDKIETEDRNARLLLSLVAGLQEDIRGLEGLI